MDMFTIDDELRDYNVGPQVSSIVNAVSKNEGLVRPQVSEAVLDTRTTHYPVKKIKFTLIEIVTLQLTTWSLCIKK